MPAYLCCTVVSYKENTTAVMRALHCSAVDFCSALTPSGLCTCKHAYRFYGQIHKRPSTTIRKNMLMSTVIIILPRALRVSILAACSFELLNGYNPNNLQTKFYCVSPFSLKL